MYRKNRRQRVQTNALKVDDIVPSEQQKAASKALAQIQKQEQQKTKVRGMVPGSDADQSMALESFVDLNRLTTRFQGVSATAQQVLRDGAVGALPTHLEAGEQVCIGSDEDDEDESDSSSNQGAGSSDEERGAQPGQAVDLSNKNLHGRGANKVSHSVLRAQRKGLQRDSHLVGQLRRQVQKMNRRIAKDEERKRQVLQQKRLKEKDEHLKKHCHYSPEEEH